MHELSIALSIVEMVEEEMSARAGIRLLAVHVKLGMLSGVAKDALLSSYDIASGQTPLAGSQLIIEEVPVLMDCPECRVRRNVRSFRELRCEVCGTPAQDIAQGRELLVSALEIAE